jgi:hypothetical protein
MLRLPEKMLARAKANLEPNIGNALREKPGRGAPWFAETSK